MPRRVVALIAAAGKGTRLGAEVPKAYVELQGQTLLERSIRAMFASRCVDEIIVTVSPSMEGFAADLLEARGLMGQDVPVRLVHGGGERADSVWAGLKAIGDEDAVVLIHDAARALTPAEMISRVAQAVADGNEAVIPVIPVADTIKRVEGSKVVDTPDRAGLRAVQTPQGFSLPALRAANEAYFASPSPGFIATDDASLMEWHGTPVACVEGDVMAFKITTPLDLTLANALLAEIRTTSLENK